MAKRRKKLGSDAPLSALNRRRKSIKKRRMSGARRAGIGRAMATAAAGQLASKFANEAQNLAGAKLRSMARGEGRAPPKGRPRTVIGVKIGAGKMVKRIAGKRATHSSKNY